MEEYVSLRDVLDFAKRHKKRIFMAVGGVLLFGLIVTYMMTPIYESDSMLLVKFGREYMYRPELGERDSVTMGLNKDRQLAQINTEMAILESRELATDVLGQIGVEKLYPDIKPDPAAGPGVPPVAVERLIASVNAYNIKDSDVIRVKFQHSSPKLAAQALQVLLDKYMAKHLNAFSDAAATAFLEQKVASARKELQDTEEKLKAFQMRTRSFSADVQVTALFNQRDDLEQKRKAARSQVAGLEQRLNYLNGERQKLSTDSSRISPEETKAVADARAQLLELQLQEQKLLATFSETSRSVQNVRDQIKLVEDFLTQQRATKGQGVFADDLEKQIITAQADLRSQQAQADTLAGQIAAIEKQIGELTQSSSEYRELVRDREAAEKNHGVYTKKLEEFRASEEMDRQMIANISIIQAAAEPHTPVSPNKKLNVLISLMLGMAVGFAWGLLVDLRQRKEQTMPAVVPADQETLVAPGTIHWRRGGRAEAEAPAPEKAEALAPNPVKGNGA